MMLMQRDLENQEIGLQRGREEGRILEYINLRREDGYSDSQVREGAMKRFGLTAGEIDKYMDKKPAMA